MTAFTCLPIRRWSPRPQKMQLHTRCVPFPRKVGLDCAPKGVMWGRAVDGGLLRCCPRGTGKGWAVPSDGPFPSSLLAGSRTYRRQLWARSVFKKE